MQAKSEPIIWPNFFTSMFQVRVRFEERMNVLHSERTVENSKFTVALQPKTSRGEHNNANAKTASRGFYLWSGKRGAFHFHFNTFDSIFSRCKILLRCEESVHINHCFPNARNSIFCSRRRIFLLCLSFPKSELNASQTFPRTCLLMIFLLQQRIVVQTVEGSFQKFLFVNNGMRLKGKSLQRIEEKNKV